MSESEPNLPPNETPAQKDAEKAEGSLSEAEMLDQAIKKLIDAPHTPLRVIIYSADEEKEEPCMGTTISDDADDLIVSPLTLFRVLEYSDKEKREASTGITISDDSEYIIARQPTPTISDDSEDDEKDDKSMSSDDAVDLNARQSADTMSSDSDDSVDLNARQQSTPSSSDDSVDDENEDASTCTTNSDDSVDDENEDASTCTTNSDDSVDLNARQPTPSAPTSGRWTRIRKWMRRFMCVRR